MRIIPGYLQPALIIMVLMSACVAPEDGSQQATPPDTVGLRAASEQFYAALNALLVGEMEPMRAIWSHGDDVTNMGPFGGRHTGWTDIQAEFEKEAELKLGGKVTCTDLHVVAGHDMGYTLCVETGEHMSANDQPVSVQFRATNIFRKENGVWKIVHHQTDLSQDLMDIFPPEQ